MYDVKEVEIEDISGQTTKIKQLVFDGTIRGYEKDVDGTIIELKELSTREAIRMKRVYERIQGGYRAEEKTLLETTIAGEVFLQFRKYLPALLRDQFAQRKEDSSLGFYETVPPKEGDEKEYLV
jgi:hypothetical protein